MAAALFSEWIDVTRNKPSHDPSRFGWIRSKVSNVSSALRPRKEAALPRANSRHTLAIKYEVACVTVFRPINHSELEYYEHMEVMCPSYCGRERQELVLNEVLQLSAGRQIHRTRPAIRLVCRFGPVEDGLVAVRAAGGAAARSCRNGVQVPLL
jgi:hypothetical protein